MRGLDRGIGRFRTRNRIPPPPCGEVGETGRSPGAPGGGTERARTLRKTMTDAERILWTKLRTLKPLGLHFRRQAPFDPYILDFVCHGAKLVVEADGSQHATSEGIEHDKRRTAFLKSRGYRVLRFWNVEVLTNRDAIVDAIIAIAKERLASRKQEQSSAPPPPCGEVGEPTRLDTLSAMREPGGGPSPAQNPHPKSRAAISTSPQGGGGSEREL
jgi:very-short-patch-repair endonuclease